MPGLVCAAYAIEQLIKAGLEYKGIDPPKGRHGHDLVLLAGLLSKQTAKANDDDLKLFNDYFNNRYFDNEKGANSMTNEDYKRLDDLYYAFYKELKIPTLCHCKVGLLASVLSAEPDKQSDREILQFHHKF
jgi:hypothetical protein